MICLLKPRTIPKTTSGKIARAWCRRALNENTLQVVYRLDGDHSSNISNKESNAAIEDLNNEGATITNTKAIYQSVSVGEDDQIEIAANNHKYQTAEQVRESSLNEITIQLETMLIQVADQGPTPLSSPLDTSLPVSMMGLDSMTLVQFKGVLEKK